MTVGRPKILAIDDTPANLMVLTKGLSDEFECQSASNGPDGMALALSWQPDLVLLDIMMPGVDGFETCRRFKADLRLFRIPIIFLTALTDVGSEEKGLKLGADDYLHKPLNLKIARQRIRNLIERETFKQALELQQQHLEQLVEEKTESLRRANTELQRAKEAAETANRVKAEFLSNVSHELRTPLNIILGLTDILNRKLQDESLRQKCLKVEQAGRQLLHIVDDLLQLTRMEGEHHDLPWETTHTRELVKHIQAHFQDAASHKGLRLQTLIDHHVPAQFLGQPTRLVHVLRHFVSNAIKFSDRGDVILSVHRVNPEGGSQRLRFNIADQGVGIAQDKIEQMFEAFTQGDGGSTRRQGGLGIGLTISRHLSELMGGEIHVESELGRGSSFSITVPVQFDPNPPGSLRSPGDTDTACNAGNDAPGPAPHGLPEINDEHRLPLARILGLLQDSDTDAMTEWQDIMGWIIPFMGSDAQLMEQHLEQFAFEEALGMLQNLLSRFPQLDIQPSTFAPGSHPTNSTNLMYPSYS